jgi:hypothetical protein
MVERVSRSAKVPLERIEDFLLVEGPQEASGGLGRELVAAETDADRSAAVDPRMRGEFARRDYRCGVVALYRLCRSMALHHLCCSMVRARGAHDGNWRCQSCLVECWYRNLAPTRHGLKIVSSEDGRMGSFDFTFSQHLSQLRHLLLVRAPGLFGFHLGDHAPYLCLSLPHFQPPSSSCFILDALFFFLLSRHDHALHSSSYVFLVSSFPFITTFLLSRRDHALHSSSSFLLHIFFLSLPRRPFSSLAAIMRSISSSALP